jgi:hypothetical protein
MRLKRKKGEFTMERNHLLLILYKNAENFDFNRRMILLHCTRRRLEYRIIYRKFFTFIEILGLTEKTRAKHYRLITFFETIVDGIYANQQLRLFYNSLAMKYFRPYLIKYIAQKERLVALW